MAGTVGPQPCLLAAQGRRGGADGRPAHPAAAGGWAACRAASWCPQFGRTGVLRKGQKASADFVAGTLGLAIGMAWEEVAAGVAMD